MSIDEATRREVRRRLDRLRGEFGEFPVVETRVENDPAYFAEGRRLAERGWIGDAGAWVTDDDGRVLLIRHEGAPDLWGTPGGGHEPGESLADTARREVREETGVDCTPTGIHRARKKTIVHEADPDRRLHVLTVGFEADYGGGDLSVGDPEVLEARWFATLPEALDGFLAPKAREWADG